MLTIVDEEHTTTDGCNKCKNTAFAYGFFDDTIELQIKGGI